MGEKMNQTAPHTAKPPSQYLSQSGYALYRGWDKSRVSRLKEAGLLVFNSKGKVDVVATDREIADNRDPAKQGVADYFAKQRVLKAETANAGANGSHNPQNGTQQSVNGVDMHSKAIHIRTANEFEKLKASKRENELAEGKLMQAEDVLMTVSDVAAVIRSRLEAMPDNLSAQFAAETDEAKIRAIFTDFVDSLLGEMHRKMQQLGKGESQT
jgi:phage terminase Nu1 subunit (DNA packaging protein)